MASQPTAATSSGPPPAAKNRASQQLFLLAIFAAEIGVFSVMGRNFLTGENAFEILRVSVEIGLLALALTPVIVSGGVRFSGGSVMGLVWGVFLQCWLRSEESHTRR